VPRVKYAMNYHPKNSFSMSYTSRKVIFPGEVIKGLDFWSQVFIIRLIGGFVRGIS